MTIRSQVMIGLDPHTVESYAAHMYRVDKCEAHELPAQSWVAFTDDKGQEITISMPFDTAKAVAEAFSK